MSRGPSPWALAAGVPLAALLYLHGWQAYALGGAVAAFALLVDIRGGRR